MQNGATAHIASYCFNVSNEVFEDGLITARSLDLNFVWSYLCLNLKDKVYSNNHHTPNELSKAFFKQLYLLRSVKSKVMSVFSRCLKFV
jgi:hypothetical protein